ncbi:MAG: hypothetical protein ACR2P7_00155 [bacterium]
MNDDDNDDDGDVQSVAMVRTNHAIPARIKSKQPFGLHHSRSRVWIPAQQTAGMTADEDFCGNDGW